jgi:hypothetical protein
MATWVLIFTVTVFGNMGASSVNTVAVEFNSQIACNDAGNAQTQAIQSGGHVVWTCNRKG